MSDSERKADLLAETVTIRCPSCGTNWTPSLGVEFCDCLRKEAEEYWLTKCDGSYFLGKAFAQNTTRSIALDFYIAGRSSALKELEQVAREAWDAAWETLEPLPGEKGMRSKYESFEDYWQKKTESKEAND